MGDSNEMTIEFLRARLLAERSVSKTARQRADELAKRVMELEEQLNLISLQRKKAEKATADVLAILENHEMTQFSEDFYSSSDEEPSHGESKPGDSSMRDESSVTSKVSKNDKDEFLGSEMESSSIPGRSLSWKSSKDSARTREKKYTSSSSRRRSSSTSTDSASPKRVGKSCRQIRRRETRLAVEQLQTDTNMVTSHDNGVSTCSEDYPNFHDSESGASVLQNREEKLSVEDAALQVSRNPRDGTVDGPFLSCGSDKDMERALEHQAQLIGQYEAEEKAQREWEEKFRENNNSTPDSCEPGNQSDITEERDEIKAQPPSDPSGIISSQDQEAKSKLVNVCSTEESSQNHPHPHVNIGSLQDQKVVLGSPNLASESSTSEFTFPYAKGKQIQESSEICAVQPNGNIGNRSTDTIESSHAGTIFSTEERGKNELSLVPHYTSNKLGSVLQALQQAKLSLTHKLNTKPLIEDRSVLKAIEPSLPAARSEGSVDVPVGCTGLFRVPSDFHFEATTRNLGSGSRLSLMNYGSDRGISANAGERFTGSPFMETRFDYSGDSRFFTTPSNPYTEKPRLDSGVPSHKPFSEPRFDVSGPSHKPFSEPHFDSGIPSHKPFFEPRLDADPYKPLFEPRLDAGLPSSKPFFEPRFDMGVPSQKPFFEPRLDFDVPSYRRYTSLDPNLNTSLDTSGYNHPSYPNFIPQMPSNDNISRPPLSGGSAIPPRGNYYTPSYDDQIRPNMYR